MRRRAPLLLAAVLLAVAASRAEAQLAPDAALDSPELLLEEAHYVEVARGEPARAVEIYRRLAARDALAPSLRGLARLRLGICQRVLGEEAEARRYFQLVLDEHAEQAEVARVAREYLGGTRAGEPIRFMPPDVLLYAEIVRPAEHVRTVTEVLDGTPFQNPVDYYIEAFGSGGAPSRDGERGADDGGGAGEGGEDDPSAPPIPRLPPGVREAAAVLNESLLRDLQSTEAIALALLPSFPRDQSFLLAIFPGESDIVGALAHWAISMRDAAVVSHPQRLPIFRLDEERGDTGLHVALGASLGSHVILLGQPRAALEDAVERYALGHSSLRESADFHALRSGGTENVAFAYISPDHLAASLLDGVPEPERAARARLFRALGHGALDEIRVTVSHSPGLDVLRVAFLARVRAHDFPAWRALATDAIDAALLRTIPGDALGYVAAALDPTFERRAALEELLAAFAGALEPEPRAEAEQGFAALLAALDRDAARALIERLDGVAVALAPDLRGPLPGSVQAVLRVRGDDAAARVEAALATLLESTVDTRASRAFFDERITAGNLTVEVRSVEPLPGIRLRCLRLGDLFVISFSERVLLEAHRIARAGGEIPAVEGASKTLHARPALLQEQLRQRPELAGSELPAALRLILGEIDTLRVAAHPSADGASLEIVLPQMTPTLRRILTRIPRER